MVLGIFYYPWYGGKDNTIDRYAHWDYQSSPPTTYYSHFLPNMSGVETEDASIRLYDSFDQDVVERQMDLIKSAHIDVAIWSWFGKDKFTAKAMDAFWDTPESNAAGLKHCVYYERRWDNTVTQQQVIDDINYIKTEYAADTDRYYYKDGKPVVFVYNIRPANTTASLTDIAKKWRSVRDTTGIYTNLKIFSGWQDIRSYANSWHEYTPTVNYKKVQSTSGKSKYSSFVSPGFWKKYQTDAPRLARDIDRFTNDLNTMKNDGTTWKLIETWNEHPEGTGIEPSTNTTTNEIIGNEYVEAIASVF